MEIISREMDKPGKDGGSAASGSRPGLSVTRRRPGLPSGPPPMAADERRGCRAFSSDGDRSFSESSDMPDGAATNPFDGIKSEDEEEEEEEAASVDDRPGDEREEDEVEVDEEELEAFLDAQLEDENEEEARASFASLGSPSSPSSSSKAEEALATRKLTARTTRTRRRNPIGVGIARKCSRQTNVDFTE